MSDRSERADFLLDHTPLVVLVGVYLLAARWIELQRGLDLTPQSAARDLLIACIVGVFVVVTVATAFVLVFLLSRALPVLARPSGTAGVRSTWADYRRHLTGNRLAGLFASYALLYLLLNQFLAFKGAIPELSPFAWDRAFLELDRSIHLQQDPWRLLHPLVGRAFITRGLDLVYYLWFPVNGLSFAWMAWTEPGPLRRRFLLTYFLLWILLGTVAAIAFSSAGPVYYDRVTGEVGPYGALLDYLRDVDARFPLLALDVQELLWAEHTGVLEQRIEGIAAMPSLHVAIPVLLALTGWKIHRAAGWTLTGFAVLILVGSVHLAWHYAVDGYAPIVAVPLLWWLVDAIYGRLERGWRVPGILPRRSPARAPATVEPRTSATADTRWGSPRA